MFDYGRIRERRLGEPDAPFQWAAPPDWLTDDPDGPSVLHFSGEDPFPPSTDELVAGMCDLAPGFALGRRLAAVDLAELNEDQALDVVAAMDRQAAFEAARRHEALAALGRVTLSDVAADASPQAIAAAGPDRLGGLLRHWRISALAARTGTSQGVAARRLTTAAALATGGLLAATGAALARGAICDQRARLIADRLLALDAALASDVEAAVLPEAPTMSWGRLDNAIRRETIARQPLQEEAAHALARRERKVSRPSPQPAGMASMGLFGPAEDMQQLWTALDARARQAKAADTQAADASLAESIGTSTGMNAKDAGSGHTSSANADIDLDRDIDLDLDLDLDTVDARRFDALVELANGVLADSDLPRQHGRRPAITVTVALSTLLGLDERPAELEDYGAITADVARRIASDSSGTIRRLVLDECGRAVDYGTERYSPPSALAEFVITRDRTCTFPCCQRKAVACDIDHRVPYPAGATCCCNLQPLCRTHHQLKTLGLWTCRKDPVTGETHWTDRHGRTMTRAPATYDIAPTPELDQLAQILREEIAPPTKSDGRDGPVGQDRQDPHDRPVGRDGGRGLDGGSRRADPRPPGDGPPPF